MNRLVIPGGSYGECFPDGSYYVTVGREVVSHRGQLPTPPDALLRLRAHPSGLVAGEEANGTQALLWDGEAWRQRGAKCGVNAVAFTPWGSLVVNAPAAQGCALGTQGIRWIDPDGTIHTGDETYDGRGTTEVAEWTRLFDVLVGQSYVSGCTIRRDGQAPKTLELGHCTFVRFNRSGNELAIAMWKQQEHCCVLVWLTVEEIAGLPVEPAIAPAPDPVPVPVPEPQPTSMTYNTSHLQEYANTRWNELPHETREQQAESLFRILYEFRSRTNDPIEVFRKGRVGTHFLGSDGEGYAEDICVINEGANGKWYKDVGVSFGIPSARLDFVGEWLRPNGSDAEKCVAPPAPLGEPAPPVPPVPPPPQPPPDTGPDTSLRAEIAALKIRLQAETDARVTLAAQVKALSERDQSGFDPAQYGVVFTGQIVRHER